MNDAPQDKPCACLAYERPCQQPAGPNGLCKTCDCPGWPHHNDHLAALALRDVVE